MTADRRRLTEYMIQVARYVVGGRSSAVKIRMQNENRLLSKYYYAVA